MQTAPGRHEHIIVGLCAWCIGLDVWVSGPARDGAWDEAALRSDGVVVAATGSVLMSAKLILGIRNVPVRH